ncbi:MAG: PilZ domain-containing protein [Desulfuromonadales bacterium]|nr:PilZ domain-containing protein [Desulfuromonadales bacterium]
MVPVENILVSSKGFTLDREDLFKRFFRYKKLVNEVAEEKKLLEKSPSTSEESKKSIEKFLAILLEVMAGARDNFRVKFSPSVPIRLLYRQRPLRGLLLDLSVEGACIEILKGDSIPRAKNPISLEFSLPGQDKTFFIEGTVSWTKKNSPGSAHSLGIKFANLGEESQASLWQYISQAAESQSHQQQGLTP